MECNVSSVPSASYTWYKNNIVVGRTAKLTFYNLSIEDSGTYICKTISSVFKESAHKTINVNCKLYEYELFYISIFD